MQDLPEEVHIGTPDGLLLEEVVLLEPDAPRNSVVVLLDSIFTLFDDMRNVLDDELQLGKGQGQGHTAVRDVSTDLLSRR